MFCSAPFSSVDSSREREPVAFFLFCCCVIVWCARRTEVTCLVEIGGCKLTASNMHAARGCLKKQNKPQLSWNPCKWLCFLQLCEWSLVTASFHPCCNATFNLFSVSTGESLRVRGEEIMCVPNVGLQFPHQKVKLASGLAVWIRRRLWTELMLESCHRSYTSVSAANSQTEMQSWCCCCCCCFLFNPLGNKKCVIAEWFQLCNWFPVCELTFNFQVSVWIEALQCASHARSRSNSVACS